MLALAAASRGCRWANYRFQYHLCPRREGTDKKWWNTGTNAKSHTD